VISGESYSSTGFTIDSLDITVADSMMVVVPKYSMVVISFSGDDLGYELLPLGYFDYQRATDISIRSKEDDGFDITRLRGSKTFVAEFEPADALIKIANWEVIPNDVNMKYSTNGNEIRITSTGTCDGNGSILLKASLKDNLLISDEVTVNISNQGSNCELGIAEHDIHPSWCVYPNPVDGNVFILDSAVESPNALVIITNMAGERVLQEEMKSPVREVQTQGWKAGIYTLSILQDGNLESIKILIK
jgi:hypothetical protein